MTVNQLVGLPLAAVVVALLVVALLITTGCARRAPPADDYQTYTNARFGYSVCYPANRFEAQPEAENGDGRKFIARNDGALLLVYGMNNALAQSLQELYDEKLETYRQPTAEAAYKELSTSWFVVSGTKGDRVIYRKTILKDSQFKTFQIEYGKSQKAIYDPIVAKIAGCFQG